VQRFVVGRGAELRYHIAGPTSPSDVTVTVTRDIGTAIVTAQAATDATGGTFTYQLPVASTLQLDRLSVAWTADTGETYYDAAEIAGGEYFTVSDARALRALRLTESPLYSDLDIAAARVAAETALEDACAVAFVPRYFSQTSYSARRQPLLAIPRVARLRSIRSATADGVPVDVSSAVLLGDGTVYLATNWPAGSLVVRGEHGYDSAPPRVARAALKLAKSYLVDSAISDRTMRHTNQHGETEIFVTEGRGGAEFSLPECNAVVDRYGVRSGFLVA
jgi:hypothetical protein